MNTKRFTKTTRIALITLGLLLAGLTTAVIAGEKFTGKGGATLLRPAASTQSVSSAEPMSCAKCTDKWVARQDLSARGANKPTVLVVSHQCGGCATTLAMAGQGKAAHQVASHSCAMADTSCCLAKSANTPANKR